jgi:hypothetical protein
MICETIIVQQEFWLSEYPEHATQIVIGQPGAASGLAK